MSSNADLPDLNVWLALATPDHFHHQPALDDWEQQAAEQNALLYRDGFGPDERGRFLSPACTDAYLSALAISNGWRLVSFDRGFERFGDLLRLKLNGTSSACECSQDPSELC